MLSNRRVTLLYALWAMSRPSQLLAVTLVYLFGLVIALARDFAFAPQGVLWGYLALIPAAASIHYANEYADKDTDALTTRTPFSGGSGALLKTGAAPIVGLRAAWISAAISALLAIVGLLRGHLHENALLVLAAGVFFGWMYSLPPLALAWNGWGELDNAALGGVLLPIYGFVVLADRMDTAILLAVIPFGLLVFINLLATTWPDRDADAAVGKNTLATRHSTKALRILYWVTAAAAFLLLSLLDQHILPPVVSRASMLTAPVVIWGGVAYTRQESPLPTVAAMIIMLFAQILGWIVSIG